MLDLSRLSPEQRRVALAPDGPLLVVAGPGSGKTTTLVARIGVLVALRRVPPSSILALTYTDAAAREMRARLGRSVEGGTEVDVCTFHSWGLRAIRRWSRALGYGGRRPTVYDEDAARRLLREAAGPAERAGRTGHPHSVPLEELVDRARHAAPLAAGSVRGGPIGPTRAKATDPHAELAARYERLLVERGAVDFTGMLVLPLRLLLAHSPALRLYRETYRHVLCDEFQDLCRAEHALVRLLGLPHGNVTAVGDPNQTVFTWRGADARLLTTFARDFAGARVLALDRSFRSTRRIVRFANALGSPLSPRPSLRTEREDGPHIVLHAAAGEREEASFVASEIRRLFACGEVRRFGDVAALYRTNRQAHVLALALRDRGVPCRAAGAGELLAHPEVRDALAYLRLAHDPADAPALARVADVPPRGLARVSRALRAEPVAAADLLGFARRTAPEEAGAARELVGLLRLLRRRTGRVSVAQLLDEALASSGYSTWLAHQPDAETRLRRLGDLRAVAALADGDLGVWLAHLTMGQAAEPPTAADHVTLTTIHGAKGKEWRVVFVLGLEDGLLPHRRALVADADTAAQREALLDELRLAYVAVTRPKERLYLTYSRARGVAGAGGTRASREPSRFLRHAPASLVRRAA